MCSPTTVKTTPCLCGCSSVWRVGGCGCGCGCGCTCCSVVSPTTCGVYSNLTCSFKLLLSPALCHCRSGRVDRERWRGRGRSRSRTPPPRDRQRSRSPPHHRRRSRSPGGWGRKTPPRGKSPSPQGNRTRSAHAAHTSRAFVGVLSNRVLQQVTSCLCV